MKAEPFADRLDALLREEHSVSPGLEQRILASVPAADGLQRLIDWVACSMARAALATAVPLALGFAAGFNLHYDPAAQFDEELVMLAFAEFSEAWNYE